MLADVGARACATVSSATGAPPLFFPRAGMEAGPNAGGKGKVDGNERCCDKGGCATAKTEAVGERRTAALASRRTGATLASGAGAGVGGARQRRGLATRANSGGVARAAGGGRASSAGCMTKERAGKDGAWWGESAEVETTLQRDTPKRRVGCAGWCFER